VSEDSDLNELLDLNYNVHFDIDMLSANVEDMFNDNNDRGGESKEAGVV
jgi:hypothetical protein